MGFTHTREPHYVIALHAVDRVPVARATYATTFRHFRSLAPDLSTVVGRDSCTLASKKLGIRISFEFCGHLGHAVVTGPGWQTPNGLHIGSTVRLLRRLFPHALNTKLVAKSVDGVPASSIEWDLASVPQLGLYPVLVAYVRNWRVAAFGIEIAGH
jgi:hypothetical protein